MKKPVTKQKKAALRGKRQYTVFANLARKKLRNQASLVDCPNCREKKLNHHICKSCGFYGEKQVRKGASDSQKITKIQA